MVFCMRSMSGGGMHFPPWKEKCQVLLHSLDVCVIHNVFGGSGLDTVISAYSAESGY